MGIYTIEQPDGETRPGCASFVFSHDKNYSQDEYFSIVQPLLDKYGHELGKISSELISKHSFELVQPTIASVSGTVQESEK